MAIKRNPFAAGFRNLGTRSKQGRSASYITKKSLLKMMLEVELTAADLPVKFADQIREKCPGFLDNVERKFTMAQIMEMLQFQLLFSNSGYIVQDAINAIKDRAYGKPMQQIQLQHMDAEPTEMRLPNGRVIVI